MKITDYLQDRILFLDGGMGTLLQARGLTAGELPERWNITHKDVITEIHRAYFDAGCNVVNTNTFGANILKFPIDELEKIICAACENAKRAAAESASDKEKFIALDIGPTGKMLKPYGDFEFEEAVAVFAETVKLGVKYGVDLIFVETMSDSYETKAAVIAAKENSALPVFVSNAYGEDGKLMTGASPEAMVAMLEGLSVDAIGVNCSLGPKALSSIVREYLRASSLPVMLKPNAGLPKCVDGKTVYDVTPDEFAAEVAQLVREGVRVAGGCCGTTPEYIRALVSACEGITPEKTEEKSETVISSYTHALKFGDAPVLIGERINPTGKKLLKEALRSGDMDYVLRQGVMQEDRGVHALDVNVGLPDIDEAATLTKVVRELQAIIDLPLQIDTANPDAMEKALRIYNGKPLINSVNGKKESMDRIFPIAKKYGGVIIALTLDESGIPETAEGRVAIAERIIKEAEKYGIKKKDLIFDTLALTVSADKTAASETLRALRIIRNELGCHTSLGVSNVSFGLPARDMLNGVFFSLALANGLSAAIMNPASSEMMKTYYAYRALSGNDENFAEFIEFAESQPEVVFAANAPTGEKLTPDLSTTKEGELRYAIVKGLCSEAARVTQELLATTPALDIVSNEVIPALNKVGEGFEKKTVYLPSLLMSAEAAKAAFEVVKASMQNASAGNGCKFVLATVEGDIHDIGKNIVKLLLENYGYDVIDLGRDVAVETIVEETVKTHAPLVGLSALMTTTVPAMEKTIKELRIHAPWAKIVVGGAVLTQDYADKIGADHYAKDAMEAVRYAQSVCR